MADLPSILGGLAQGFVDFGKSAVDLFGTGGAAVGDAIESLRTGKVTTKNQDDFRKWLYGADSVEDAAAKGLGTALNGVQTVTDYIPGIGAVTRNPLFNAGQGALGGLADEFKTYGKDYDLARAGQRAAVSAGSALAGSGLAEALKGSGNAILKSNLAQGAARGGLGGAITGGGYAAIDGGDAMQGALQGAKMGALIGGATGAIQDFKPAKTYDVALTDDERASRIKNARSMRNKIGSEKAYMSGALSEADADRWSELWNLEQAYKNGFDTYEDYHNTLRPVKGLDEETLNAALKNMEAPELQPWMQEGTHQPTFDPAMSSLASSMDKTISGESFMPDDFYQHMDWYGGGDTLPDIESARVLQKIKGNPNAKVTMYRATVGDKIYPNDWVTLSPEYAKMHLANALRDQPDAKIIKQTVAARDLRWPGDDINEFGYYPITNGDIAKAKNVNAALETALAADDMAVNSPKYVLDENGQPKTFYHGSPNTDITEFDLSRAGRNTQSGEKALYFTDSPEVADEFSYERLPTDSLFVENRGKKGKVYPVNLDMRNTLDLDNLTDAQIDELWPYASTMGSWQGQDVFTRDMRNWRDVNNSQLIKGYLDMEKLAGSPYDSFSARMYPNTDNMAKEYGLFDSSRVKMLEDALAGDDMAVNNAPDIMASKAVNNNDGSISVFTGDMDSKTRRALDIITNQDVPTENELYNRIDPETLPQGYEKLRDLIDNKVSIDEQVEKKLGKNPLKADVDELLDYLYPNEPLEKKVFHKSLNESIEKYKRDAAALGVDASKAAEDMTRTKKLELVKKIYDRVKFDTVADIGEGIDVGDDLLYATQAYNHRGIRTGYPGALDTALSERLEIAPGNTIKITDSQYDWTDDDFKRKNLGRYTRNAKDISVREGISGIEGDISTMAHERLHSFQNEARPENIGRYSKEVTDAYNELSKDLKPYIKDSNSVAKIYGASDTDYYASPIEQESRMLQTYLDNKGYTKDALFWRNKQNGGKPEWGDEINPAFDKFFDKLRDLSKRGIALPALTALLGSGAYMASQDNKKKEVK